MQHLEFAFSLSKHLMGLSAAIVALVFAFIGDFQETLVEQPSNSTEILVFIFSLSSALSICSGLFGLGYITNLAERSISKSTFISLFQPGAGVYFFRFQQFFFFISILSLVMPLLDLASH